jgi:hypothetical protein
MKLINKLFSKISPKINYSIGLSHLLNLRPKYKKIKNINDLDFKIFSQNGEDGIIDYLLFSLNIDKPKFIEIGVGDYTECNTRFIFERSSPKGLIIDCISDLKNKISKNIKLWRGDLTIIESFISSQNINNILKKYNFNKYVDLFSLDIDGVDYWILKELPKDFSKIAVIEFNSTFGSKKEISVPNEKNFDRSKYHYSNLCYGASLKAIISLMKKKNFVFIGTNLHRVNAFFVSKKYINKINLKIPKDEDLEKYTKSNIRESRSKKNTLSYLSGKKKIEQIHNCDVLDVSKQKPKKQKIKSLF